MSNFTILQDCTLVLESIKNQVKLCFSYFRIVLLRIFNCKIHVIRKLLFGADHSKKYQYRAQHQELERIYTIELLPFRLLHGDEPHFGKISL